MSDKLKSGCQWLATAMMTSLALLAGPAHAAPLLVHVDATPPEGLPLGISGELAALLAAGDGVPATHLQYVVYGPRQLCASQMTTDADGVDHLYWQSQGEGTYAISAQVATGATTDGESGGVPMARQMGDSIHISNAAFTVVHRPDVAGGLPSSITVAGAKRALPIDYADRLYRADVGQFSLAANPRPAVRLIANGPLFATVEVSSGYYHAQAGQTVQHTAHPQARYRFTYFQNSPFVQVNIVVSQADPFAWQELHVLELRAKASGRTPITDHGASGAVPRASRWAGGEPALEGAVAHAVGTQHFSRWAALYFDAGVVAVMNPQALTDVGTQARIYDGPGLTYLMGPWTEFAGPRVEFNRYLYFGPSQVPCSTMDELAGRIEHVRQLRVELPELEARVQSLRRTVAAILLGPCNRTPRMLWLWRLNQALADLHTLRNVAAARTFIDQPPSLQASPGSGFPATEMVALGAGRNALVTNQLLLVFDSAGRLTSLYQASTDTDLLSQPCAMFRFVARNSSGVEALLTAQDARQVTAEFQPGTLHLQYSGFVFGTTPVHVDLALRPEGSSIFWRASAAVDGQAAACWRLDFPVLDGVGRRAGDDGDDAVIVPDGWGRWLPRPSVAHYQGRYPGGNTTMQCVGYVRGNTTLGVIARDGRCFAKDFVALGREDPPTIALEVRHYPEEMGYAHSCAWPYEVETVALDGDWFTLAEHYRAWATRQAWCEGGRNRRRLDSPAWFRKLVWWHHDGTRDGAQLIDTFEHLRQAVPFPLAFHWYNWHSIPFDNFYPDYFPVNAYVPEVREKLRAWGVRVMPYINGHLWDTQAKSYVAEGAQRWAMKKFDDSLYIEHWNNHDHSTACPFTAAWRDKLVQVTDRLFRDVGVDAVYLDQIGATQAQLCYDGTHGHPRGGGDYYVAGYWNLLHAVRENARRINPDAAMTTEDTAEPYIRYLDGMLMCNRAVPDSLPFFPAVYHDYVAQFGLYIHEPEIKAGVTFRTKEAMLFQFGAQLGWNGTDWSAVPAHQEKFQWLAQLAAYRQIGLDWLAYGDMLHPPRVTRLDGSPLPLIAERWIYNKREIATDQPAVTASAWQAADGRVAIFVINVSDQPLSVAVLAPAESNGRKIRAMDVSGKPSGEIAGSGHRLHLILAPRSVQMLVAG